MTSAASAILFVLPIADIIITAVISALVTVGLWGWTLLLSETIPRIFLWTVSIISACLRSRIVAALGVVVAVVNFIISLIIFLQTLGALLICSQNGPDPPACEPGKTLPAYWMEFGVSLYYIITAIVYLTSFISHWNYVEELEMMLRTYNNAGGGGGGGGAIHAKAN